MLRLLLTAVCLVAAFAACSTETQGEASDVVIINETCPQMGDEVDAATATIYDYNGQKVGMCCGKCVDAFDALSDAEKATKLAAAGAKLGG